MQSVWARLGTQDVFGRVQSLPHSSDSPDTIGGMTTRVTVDPSRLHGGPAESGGLDVVRAVQQCSLWCALLCRVHILCSSDLLDAFLGSIHIPGTTNAMCCMCSLLPAVACSLKFGCCL